jgi:hypothetical protein
VSSHLSLRHPERFDCEESKNGNMEASTSAFRSTLPYKVGECIYSGNAEEKLRIEAATYIWLRENCPDIPIPELLGFGLPGGHSVWMVFFQSRRSSLIHAVYTACKLIYVHENNMVSSTCHFSHFSVAPLLSIHKLQTFIGRGAWIYDPRIH